MPKVFGSSILLPKDPTDPLEAATKQYVDANVGGGATIVPTGLFVRPTSGQAIAANTLTFITLDSAAVGWNDGGWTFSGGGAVCPAAGRYLCIGQVRFGTFVPSTANQGRQDLHVYVNGAALATDRYFGAPVSDIGAGNDPVGVATVLELVTNDIVTIWGLQDTGASRTVQVSSSYIQLERLGAGPAGPTGDTGATGAGVPTGGTTDQVLAKTSGTDYATAWVSTERVITWPTGSEPSLSGIPDGTMWVEYTP